MDTVTRNYRDGATKEATPVKIITNSKYLAFKVVKGPMRGEPFNRYNIVPPNWSDPSQALRDQAYMDLVNANGIQNECARSENATYVTGTGRTIYYPVYSPVRSTALTPRRSHIIKDRCRGYANKRGSLFRIDEFVLSSGDSESDQYAVVIFIDGGYAGHVYREGRKVFGLRLRADHILMLGKEKFLRQIENTLNYIANSLRIKPEYTYGNSSTSK